MDEGRFAPVAEVVMTVEIAIRVDEAVAEMLRRQNPDLPRLGLEKLICTLYRDGLLSKSGAMRELGISGRLAFEALLSRHNLHREWPDEESAAEFATLNRLERAG
jgi:hypothetical protein